MIPKVVFIWVQVFKNGPGKICGRQLLKNLKFFKGCLPQILLGQFLNTLALLILAGLNELI